MRNLIIIMKNIFDIKDNVLIKGLLKLFLQFLTSFVKILHFFFWKSARKIPESWRDCLIMHSLSLSSFASLSEYGPHRLPISLVCRRLQRLLQLADPPGRGPRARPSSSATPERQTQRAATAAAAAETQPHTGYPPTPMQDLLCDGCLPGPLTPTLYNSRQFGSRKTVLLTTKSPTVTLSPIPNNAPLPPLPPNLCVASKLFAHLSPLSFKRFVRWLSFTRIDQIVLLEWHQQLQRSDLKPSWLFSDVTLLSHSYNIWFTLIVL